MFDFTRPLGPHLSISHWAPDLVGTPLGAEDRDGREVGSEWRLSAAAADERCSFAAVAPAAMANPLCSRGRSPLALAASLPASRTSAPVPACAPRPSVRVVRPASATARRRCLDLRQAAYRRRLELRLAALLGVARRRAAVARCRSAAAAGGEGRRSRGGERDVGWVE